MCQIEKTGDHQWFLATDVDCVINVQHNCHDGGCVITNTQAHHVERQPTQEHLPEITHKATNLYIINAAALYSAEVHCWLTH
ncbi:hypothetical protein CROQUDRAFT_100284 [Cronartium quercuum f. sp. fusiforme G11]|uniref:Uncharacterized protein n=1 Tax=Cronartium quercuum f. sp. fusiforme G11 TaxID=708437 RepID=A0A9P6T685_9BASI|nr:hypothetical protein CROQUDRAFT_100284 [Cronartium quercuum f. sp. fusiforme G11]